MKLSSFITRATGRLEGLYPAGEARSIITILYTERLGIADYIPALEPSYEIDGDTLSVLESDVCRLCSGEPVQYVTGVAWFCGRRFKVGPGVLIPRPETEELAQYALAELPRGGSALDLCTGSGCIAWTLALGARDSAVVGVDISEAALTVAAAQPLEGNRPEFRKGDILSEESYGGDFDVITCNPPYVLESEKAAMRRNVLEFEPEQALFVPDSDPLVFHKAASRIFNAALRPGGFGIIEINESLGPETAEFFSAAGFGEVELVKDFRGKNRFVRVKKALF